MYEWIERLVLYVVFGFEIGCASYRARLCGIQLLLPQQI